MPDHFDPYPSPITSWGSPAQTRAADPVRPAAVDRPAWATDPCFDGMYPNEPEQPQLTAEEMAAFLELERMFGPSEFPLPANVPAPDGQAGQMNLSTTSENVVPLFSFDSNINHPLQPAFQSFTPHDSPTYSVHTHSQQHSQQQSASLSPLALGTAAFPPSPPYTYDTYQQLQPYHPQQRQCQLPLFYPPTHQIQQRPREPERMALPGAGDLNVSMCEVIM